MGLKNIFKESIIVENKEIEKLKFSELVLNTVNLIVLSCNENGSVSYVSQATEKIIGYKTNKLLGENWWDLTFFSKEEGQYFRKKVSDFISGKIKIDKKPYERKLRCKDGSHKWIEWRDTLGEGNTYISVGVDIDDWKKKEEIKILSDAILEKIDSMILVSKSDGDILFASPSVEKMIGYASEEILGDKWWKVTYDDPDEALKVKNAIYYNVFFNQKSLIDISKRKIRTKNGKYKWIEWQMSKGANETIISIGTEITDRILAEIELKEAKESAEKSLKVKNEFLANMSHEIRTPLNAVIGFTDLLLESKLSQEQRTHLETMRNSGEILLSLINNVLDLSKLDSEKLEIEEISFNLHKNMNEIVRIMKIKADEKKISLDIVIEPNTPIEVIGDPTRLGQILLNLIGNAVKFTNEGSVIVHVKQQNEAEGISNVIFEIKDTGIGIVSNKINTVFGAFTQAKSDTSRIYGGTGLGLAIVKKLVHLLNGTIKVDSQFGKGSVFKMTLPLKISDKSISEKQEHEISIDQPLGLSILLVDDNKTNQLLGKTRLERWECEVDIANNGIEGVKKAQQKKYDVILMDIQMPIMDGYEATKIIKNDISDQAAKTPIIAMSAYTSKSDIKRALDAGMDDYVFKPFKPKELYRILEKYGKINEQFKDIENEPVNKKIKQYIDLEFLKEETQNESSLLKLLIESFLNDIEEFLKDLDKDFKGKNWEALHKATHKIKPSISMFGISELDTIIHTLINRFREREQLEDVGLLINSCKEIFIQVKNELLTELKLLDNE